MRLANTLAGRGLKAGIVVARGVKVGPQSAALAAALATLAEQRRSEDFPTPVVKEAVRALLRGGGFKPSGRSKPASEYLAQAAREGRFPAINNLVDVNNLVSLASGLPVSLLDLDAFGDGATVTLRYGRAGESYAFNAAGHAIDLEGLISVTAQIGDRDEPLGNPVKDSMRGKIAETTKAVIGVIYAPAEGPGAQGLDAYLATFAEELGREGGSKAIETHIV